MWSYGRVRTTIEIPAPLLRRAKASAAEHGQSLRQLLTEALLDKLRAGTGRASAVNPAWMDGFGKLRRLRKETQRIQARIEGAFERVDPVDRA